MTRRASGYPRRTRQRTSRRTILVFTEGEKTEEQYLSAWHRKCRDRIAIKVDSFHGVPLSLVNKAVETQKTETRDQRRGHGSAYDEIWCMFDIDSHPKVPEAIQKAKTYNIGLAISNPCIELWFILHFEGQTAYLTSHDAQSRSFELLGCRKNLSSQAVDLLCNNYEDALERAQLLDTKHYGDGSPLGSNPSSSVWTLINLIRA